MVPATLVPAVRKILIATPRDPVKAAF